MFFLKLQLHNYIELNINSEKNASKILKMLRMIGDISDLTAYSGPLGKLLAGKLWTLDVGPYERIEVEDFPKVEEKVLKKFSNDAKDLYRLCIAVTSGMKHVFISGLLDYLVGKGESDIVFQIVFHFYSYTQC